MTVRDRRVKRRVSTDCFVDIDTIRCSVPHGLVKRAVEVLVGLDGILSQAARKEPTYLDFLDQILAEETDAKERKRVAMGITIAHFPAVKTLEEFDF